MRKILIIASLILFSINTIKAQTSDSFKYQAVVRDNSGMVLTDQMVGLQVAIIKDSPSGSIEYKETFSPETNKLGLFQVFIGTGNVVSGDFSKIAWGESDFFIETSIDFSGGTSYILMGTSQLLSVPFALHSKTTEKLTVKTLSERDLMTNLAIGQLIFCTDCNNGEVQVYDGNSWKSL